MSKYTDINVLTLMSDNHRKKNNMISLEIRKISNDECSFIANVEGKKIPWSARTSVGKPFNLKGKQTAVKSIYYRPLLWMLIENFEPEIKAQDEKEGVIALKNKFGVDKFNRINSLCEFSNMLVDAMENSRIK